MRFIFTVNNKENKYMYSYWLEYSASFLHSYSSGTTLVNNELSILILINNQGDHLQT